MPSSDGQEYTHQEEPLSHPNVKDRGLFKKVGLQPVPHYCFIYVIWTHQRIAEIPSTSGSLVQERFPSQMTLVILIIRKSQGTTILYKYQIQQEC